ncbi:MAG: M23 family metallopeptidase [Oscillospiraceae bacterium]|nr:M23 family metallopeptidase [Oscillospiraceae bacterium]
MNDYKKERLKQLFSSKQFLIAVAMCVVVAAVGGYYAYTLRQITKIKTPPVVTEQRTTQRATTPDITRPANNDVTGMPDIRATAPPAAATLPQDETPADNVPVTKAAPTSFSLPLGTDIGKDFSRGEMVFNPTLGDWRVHNGVDFLGAVGDTVKAVAAGTVKKVYDDTLWGTVMEIDHGGGIVAKYCGLGKGSTLAEGTAVKMNDTIGNLGTVPCEKNEVEHLHFEIHINGAVNDPLEVLGRSESAD